MSFQDFLEPTCRVTPLMAVSYTRHGSAGFPVFEELTPWQETASPVQVKR